MRQRRQRQLHRAGLVTNYGPKAARARRELQRVVAAVRKVLWKRPGLLVMWVDRDVRQARASGAGFFANEKLNAPYQGRVIGMGPRALLILRGRTPDAS